MKPEPLPIRFPAIVIGLLSLVAFGPNCMAEPISTGSWLSGLTTIERQARSFSALSPDRQFSLVLLAHKWSGLWESWSPPPKNDHAQVHCAMAAQSLANYLSDLQQRRSSASVELSDYREYKSKCVRALR
jgi:hypothetical protein